MTDLEAFEADWARCAPYIEAALDEMPEPTHGIEDVKAAVERRDNRLWAGRNSAMITELQVWPKTKRLLIWLAGGEMGELVEEMLPMVEAYAKDQGCSRCYIVGRPGWARVLKAKAYDHVSTVMMKGL